MALNVGQGDGNTPDRGYELYIAAVVMVIVAGFFVIGRLAARWTKMKFGMDDYTIALSLVRSYGSNIDYNTNLSNLPSSFQLCSIGLSITINLGLNELLP